MTREQITIVTRVAGATALVAALTLLLALVVPAISTTGLWILLSVPLARNVAVVFVAAGRDRVFGFVGAVISAAVVAFAVLY